VTTPRGGRDETLGDALAETIYKLAEVFDNCYVIDLHKYAPVYDDAFRKKFFLGGHMNPMGYMLTAKMVVSYIDYIIRHNMADFAQVGFIGTEHQYREV
ncbi:MAG: SGNH/GDSL hydrolase family protein, partial [Clostridia bacterium]|nr:SGNH/GDSL hydrolase family protein [Clostridia bacterium]